MKQRMITDDFPTCRMHYDCFANRDGKCIALTDNCFKRGYCPFYKSENKVNEERKKCGGNYGCEQI